MGASEDKAKKQIRLTKIQNAILGTVALSGLVAVAIVAPNVLQVLGATSIGKKRYHIQNTKRSMNRLIKNGLLKIKKSSDGQKYVELTERGETQLNLIKYLNYKPDIPRKWDKKFRLVIFDINEKRKKERDLVRKTLSNIGFMRLQDSVWIFPYDCEDFITLLKTDSKFGSSVLYMIVDQIENEDVIKKAFNL